MEEWLDRTRRRTSTVTTAQVLAALDEIRRRESDAPR